MNTLHVWPQEVQCADGFVTHSALVEDTEPYTVWFKAREEHASLLTTRAETFVASTILLAMLRGAPLRVHAPLSPSFLRNIEELQAIWSCWYANSQRVDIIADAGSESTIQAPERAISMFSGGVDSCYTVWRHTQQTCGRRALPLQTALMYQGGEVRLGRDEMFARARQRSQSMLAALDVNLVALATNSFYVMPPTYPLYWFGTVVTSLLLLFQESHTTGLVPAALSYNQLVLPHSLTPLNIPLYSTARFAIEYDGGGARVEKLRAILAWPQVVDNLRVCNKSEFSDVNCGKCEKCVRNILMLRVVGVQDPPCFPNTLSDHDIAQVKLDGVPLLEMEGVVAAAEEARIADPWLRVLTQTVRRNQRRIEGERRWNPVRQRIARRVPAVLRRIWRSARRRSQFRRGR